MIPNANSIPEHRPQLSHPALIQRYVIASRSESPSFSNVSIRSRRQPLGRIGQALIRRQSSPASNRVSFRPGSGSRSASMTANISSAASTNRSRNAGDEACSNARASTVPQSTIASMVLFNGMPLGNSSLDGTTLARRLNVNEQLHRSVWMRRSVTYRRLENLGVRLARSDGGRSALDHGAIR